VISLYQVFQCTRLIGGFLLQFLKYTAQLIFETNGNSDIAKTKEKVLTFRAEYAQMYASFLRNIHGDSSRGKLRENL